MTRFSTFLAAAGALALAVAAPATTSQTAGPIVIGWPVVSVSCDVLSTALVAQIVEAGIYGPAGQELATLAPTSLAPGAIVSLVWRNNYRHNGKPVSCGGYGEDAFQVSISTIGSDHGSAETVAGRDDAGGGIPLGRCEHGEVVIGIGETGLECACADTGASALDYFTDADQDGYSPEAEPSDTTCFPSEQQIPVSPGLDCDDSHEYAHPDSFFLSFERPSGGFDWNCDGVEEINPSTPLEGRAESHDPLCRTAPGCPELGGLVPPKPFDGLFCGETWGFSRCTMQGSTCRQTGSATVLVTCR